MYTGPIYTGIIDLYHGDKDILAAAAADNIGAVILKVCTGVGCPDSAFAARFTEARSLGMDVGGYSFLTGQHGGAAQWADFRARWDVACAAHGLDPRKLPVWADYESNPSGAEATPQHARDFLAAGRADGYRVGIYSGASRLRRDFPAGDPVGAYPLWEAAYGPDPRAWRVPPAWEAHPELVVLQQYTNGGDGPSDTVTFPRKIRGAGGCDRSCFRGTEADLRAWWRGDVTP